MSNHKKELERLRKESEVAQMRASLADQNRHLYELLIKQEDLEGKVKQTKKSIEDTNSRISKLEGL